MKFSIIIPMYNVQGYIGRCLQSVLNQNFSDYELILVDDESTDGTLEEVNQLLVKYPDRHNIYIITKKNSGASDTRNAGIRIAKGEYVVFMDADDQMTIDALKTMDDATRNENADLYVFSLKKEIDGIIVESELSKIDSFIIREENGVRALERYLDKTKYIITWQPWSKVFKRDIINRFDLQFDTSLYCCNDFNFFINYFLHANSVIFNNTPVTVYNYGRPGSISWTKVEKRLKSSMRAYSDMFHIIKDTNIESSQLLSYMSYLYLCAIELAFKLNDQQFRDINATIQRDQEVFNYAKDKISVFKRLCYKTLGVRLGGLFIDFIKKSTRAIRNVNSDI